MNTTASMLELTIATSLGIAIALDATLPVGRRSDPETAATDAGRWYTRAMVGAFLEAITTASLDLAGAAGAERRGGDRGPH